ncbi:hypothetical protein ACVXHB_22700 [Escherichia coli]
MLIWPTRCDFVGRISKAHPAFNADATLARLIRPTRCDFRRPDKQSASAFNA